MSAQESVVAEALPGVFALPDVDDAEALGGRTRDMQDEAVGCGIHEPRGDPFVVLPARRNVLHECVRHVTSSCLVAQSRSGVTVAGCG